MLIEMIVAGIGEDANFKTPIIILKDLNGEDCLPIWVGPFEGQAIVDKMEGNKSHRPLPYDIILEILQVSDVQLERVVINKLLNNIFYAIIVLNKNGLTIEIDSRSSDAINIAIRSGVQIFVEDDVIKKAVSCDLSGNITKNYNTNKKKKISSNNKKIKGWLDKLNPEDFT